MENKMKNFCEINFGLAAGEDEASRHPELIKNGFFDHGECINALLNKDKYLVLGYKGSGKSLIGEKLLSIANDVNNVFCERFFLGDFPYSSFARILPGLAEIDNKYPLTWSWLLLLLLVNLLQKDQKAIGNITTNKQQIITQLSNIGILPTKQLRTIVTTSSKNSFKIGIKAVGIGHENNTDFETHFTYVVNLLKDYLNSAKPDSKHIIILDGLDDILSMRDIQYQSIASLLYEAGQLNNYFYKSNLNYKIIILCRTDLFERLPATNKNKQRRDSAIDIDWYHDSRDPDSSNLIAMVNMRTKLSEPECNDVFESYFPRRNYSNGKSLKHFLLDQTRHTPRDFVELLNSIKKFSMGKNKLTNNDILNGLDDYSKNYFLPEIRDEMVGYFNTEVFDSFLQILAAFRQKEISTKRIFQSCESIYDRNTVEQILRALFECSAIGNKFHGVNGHENRYYFRYRNRNYAYRIGDSIVIHNGLWKTLGFI